MTASYKDIIKMLKDRNYEIFLKEFPDYSLTNLREAKMHVNLYGVKSKKNHPLINSAYINFDNPYYPRVYKDKPNKINEYFSEYLLEIEFQLAFDYKRKIKVRNFSTVDFLGGTATIYIDGDLFKVYFKKTRFISRNTYF